MTTLSSREAILGINDLNVEPFEVPAWGGATVYLRVWRGSEREAFQKKVARAKGDPTKLDNFTETMVAMSLVDQDGNRLFAEQGDIAKLAEKSAMALEQIGEQVARLNGLTEDEDAVKNSEVTPKDASG